MPNLIAVVDATTKARFRSMASRQGLSESELLRAVALHLIANDGTTAEPLAPAPDNTEEPLGTMERVTLRLPPAFIAAARVQAKAHGMVLARWMAGVVRASVNGGLLTTDRELIELNSATRELAYLGRNLNQITRALNNDFREADRIKREWVEELHTSVTACRQAVQNLAVASINTWKPIDRKV